MKKILLLLLTLMVFLVGCNKVETDPTVPSQQEIQAKIVGTWKTLSRDGVERLTNSKRISTFNADGTGSNSHSDPKSPWAWATKTAITYTIEGNTLRELSGNNEKVSSISSIDDDNLCMKIIKKINDGVEIQDNSSYVYIRVTADYSQDIIGMWEGVEMTGYETYGDANHRIEYRADGTYTYYNNIENSWVPSDNVDNEYNVDGDWIATRWRPTTGSDYVYEWWDIDEIKDDTMKWSALREKESGERFATTFTWKKIQ